MNPSDKVQYVQVPGRQCGQRLDNFLLRELGSLPRSRIYRLIRRGEVRVNRGRCKPETRLEAGDQVRIPPHTGPQGAAPAAASEKLKQSLVDRILFEDEAMLVLNKPAGLPVHGGSGIRIGLIEALRQTRPEWFEAELAHRLDRETSGCLVIAKQAGFLRHVQHQFRTGAVDKHYLALVQGHWSQDIQLIDQPLRKNRLSSGERMVKPDPDGKAAKTRFRIKQPFANATLLEIQLETGRTHQVRVHCQHAGHPIIGDRKYNLDTPVIPHKHLALHARKISFHPTTTTSQSTFEAPLPPHFNQLLKNLREHPPLA